MKRIASFLIDIGFTAFGIILIMECLPEKYSIYGANFIISLFFCRDCISGQSIGRRIMHICVVSQNHPVSPLRAFIRNLFLLIWPIEILILIINNHRRLGDIITNSSIREIKNYPISINRFGLIILLFVNVMLSLWVFANLDMFRYLVY